MGMMGTILLVDTHKSGFWVLAQLGLFPTKRANGSFFVTKGFALATCFACHFSDRWSSSQGKNFGRGARGCHRGVLFRAGRDDRVMEAVADSGVRYLLIITVFLDQQAPSRRLAVDISSR